MSKVFALGLPLYAVNLFTCPFFCINGRILVKTFPPNGVIVKI
jgi:hypothetical protein